MARDSSPKKRGRPAKANSATEPPKKRGRPAKTQSDAPIAQIDSAIRRGRRSVAAAEEAVAEASVPVKKPAGRPAKVTETVVAADAAAPKKRVGRPRKEDAVPEAPATPKRRGRAALDLNRVAGASRVSKRTSPRSKPVARAPPKVAAAPRINPKMRSRLRHRTVPAEKPKTEAVQPVKKARGRPRKVEVETEAPAPKKAVGRGRKASAPMPAAPAKKVTARPKTAAPRKRRGYTAFEVPDRFAAQVKQLITELQAEDAANAAAAAGEADDEGEEVEIEVELGPENGVPIGLDEDEAAAELTEDHELLGAVDGADDAALDGEDELARDEEDATAPTSNLDDEFDDETELPSETAVLAEIAAVQDKIDAQVDTENDMEMAEVTQPVLGREASPGNVSIDLHGEITEVTSRPQVDGTNEVDVLHSHLDEHKHIYEPVHVPEPAPPSTIGTLFGGF